MSGGGGGIIIIKSLIDNPGTTAEEKEDCEAILHRRQKRGRCSVLDSLHLARIVYRLAREK